MTIPIIDPDNPPVGIFPHVPEAIYRKSKGVCQSNLKQVPTSPRHYLTAAITDGEEKKSTPAQVIGTITHRVILESRWDCVVKPEGMKLNTKDGMAWKAAQTMEWIDHDEAENIKMMALAVKNHPEARKILYGKGDNEVACWKIDPATGLLLKARADRVTMDDTNRTVLPDIKTCPAGGAAEEVFRKEIGNWGYYRQAAFYLDIFEASAFIIVAVEKEPPYGVACYEVDPYDIALGRAENVRDLAIVKRCADSGNWPCYPETIKRISLPDYQRRRLEGV